MLAIVNKPPGISSQPDLEGRKPLVATPAGPDDWRPVHRLDRAVSGAIVVARGGAVAQVSSQWGAVRKEYVTVLRPRMGATVPDSADVNSALVELPDGRVVLARGLQRGSRLRSRVREAATGFARLSGNAFHAKLQATGVRHQIRAHAALALYAPVEGDVKYGGRGETGVLKLHCASVECEELGIPLVESALGRRCGVRGI